jgi:hypothetical protein
MKFNFAKVCTDMLKDLGAVESDCSYGMSIQTIAGRLQLHAYDTWLATRFDDEKAAVRLIGDGSLNPYSGKWNWHFTKPTQSDVDWLRSRIEKILIKEPRDE